MDITIDDLLTIKGIGQAKAMQIISAIALVKRIYKEQNGNQVPNKQDEKIVKKLVR